MAFRVGGGFNPNMFQDKLNKELDAKQQQEAVSAESQEAKIEAVEQISDNVQEDERAREEAKQLEQMIQQDAIETDNKMRDIRNQLGIANENAQAVTGNQELYVAAQSARSNRSAAEAARARLDEKRKNDAAGGYNPWNKYK